MKIGVDISHWNEELQAQQNLTDLPFMFIKATEGKTYTDAKGYDYLLNYAALNNNDGIIGFYHFAHCESNNATDEANHFISTVKKWIEQCEHTYKNVNLRYMLALDVEAKALTVLDNTLNKWISDFSASINREFGCQLLLYVSASVVKRLYPYIQTQADDSPFIWVAHYNVDKPRLHTNISHYGIWQCTSKPFDINIMYDRFINRIDDFLLERG